MLTIACGVFLGIIMVWVFMATWRYLVVIGVFLLWLLFIALMIGALIWILIDTRNPEHRNIALIVMATLIVPTMIAYVIQEERKRKKITETSTITTENT